MREVLHAWSLSIYPGDHANMWNVFQWCIPKQLWITPHYVLEPSHEKTCLCHMRTTKAQISCLDSIIPLVSKSEISSLYLASVAAQASLSLPWSQPRRQVFLWRGSFVKFVWCLISTSNVINPMQISSVLWIRNMHSQGFQAVIQLCSL